MKNALLAGLLLLLLPLSSFDRDSLIGRPMPLLPAKTLDGKTIDENYFKGHVTIVTFMAVGCIPCMNEINILNKLHDEYAAKGVQILCIARQMREQMVEFNSDNKKSYLSIVRNAMNVEPIRYDIQPACAGEKSNNVVNSDTSGPRYIDLKVECNILEEMYSVTGIPVTFYLDKTGIIRKVKLKGPAKPNDPYYYDEVKKEIETLLAQ